MKKEIFRHQPATNSKAFLKLAKKIKTHWLWKASRKKSKFEAWIDLLIRANFEASKESFGNDLIELQKGQLLCSQEGLAIEWGWDRSAVRHFIKLLEKDMMIASNITNKFTVITICNYDSYNAKQPAEQPAEHQVNSDNTSEPSPEFSHDKELLVSELQETEASNATSKQHQNNTYKNTKNKKNNNSSGFAKPPLEVVIEYFLEKESTQQEAETFYDHFESNGWKVGGKTLMQDWQASSRNWIRNAAKWGNKSENKTVHSLRIIKAKEIDKDGYVHYESGPKIPANWNDYQDYLVGKKQLAHFDRKVS